MQTRLVKVSEVWDESNSQLSFDKMVSVAARFVKDSDRDEFIAKANATYADEDGEVITMSSNSGKSALVLFYLVNACVQYEVSAIWLFN